MVKPLLGLVKKKSYNLVEWNKLKVENKKINIIPSASEMSDRDEILAKAYKDLIFFGRVFLPQDFFNLYTYQQTQYNPQLCYII